MKIYRRSEYEKHRLIFIAYVLKVISRNSVDLPQVDLMNFRVEYVRPLSGRCLGREAAERATKSREVLRHERYFERYFVRRVLNKQDEGLFRKSRTVSELRDLSLERPLSITNITADQGNFFPSYSSFLHGNGPVLCLRLVYYIDLFRLTVILFGR